jgi:predicted transcriptional regulator YdeE
MHLRGDLACQTLPAGPFALSTHLGHYRTLPRAYKTIVARLRELPGYDILGLPTVEVYRSTRINPECEINETDIYIPLRRRSARALRKPFGGRLT